MGNSHGVALRILVAQDGSSAAIHVTICHSREGGNPALASGSVCQSSHLTRHDVHDDLLHNTRAMTHTPASTDFAEPGLAVCGDGPLVEVIDIQDDTTQPQDVEGVPGQQGYGLRCIPAASSPFRR